MADSSSSKDSIFMVQPLIQWATFQRWNLYGSVGSAPQLELLIKFSLLNNHLKAILNFNKYGGKEKF
jgi:hypothetical protein